MDKVSVGKLKEEVSRILFEVWDPIGVKDLADDPVMDPLGCVRGEYSNYEDRIVSLLLRGGDRDAVVRELDYIARETIGVEGAIDRSVEAASQLFRARSLLYQSENG